MMSLIAHAQHYRIVGVFSNKADAAGLTYAAEKGIACEAFPRVNYGSVVQQKQAIQMAALALKPDFICLAGYMQIVAPEFIADFPNRIINIHPALLPAYPGLDTHARALRDCQESGGDWPHGCSVHLVDAGVDTGKIIAQAPVTCQVDLTEAELAARVLAREHELYPWVMNNLGTGDIRVEESKVTVSPYARGVAAERRYVIPGI